MSSKSCIISDIDQTLHWHLLSSILESKQSEGPFLSLIQIPQLNKPTARFHMNTDMLHSR